MDSKDYHITVSETFDHIEDSLRRRAVEGVESIREDERLVLQFADFRELALQSDSAVRDLVLAFDASEPRRFFYHEIEEQWFDERSQEPLIDVLNRLLEDVTAMPGTIPRKDLP
jgi:frataxin-like iron-binding protein CyaY